MAEGGSFESPKQGCDKALCVAREPDSTVDGRAGDSAKTSNQEKAAERSEGQNGRPEFGGDGSHVSGILENPISQRLENGHLMMRPVVRISLLTAVALTESHGVAELGTGLAADPAVVVSASVANPGATFVQPNSPSDGASYVVAQYDDVTVTARIRPDVAAGLRDLGNPADPWDDSPHTIGWHWIPDLDGIDTTTKACTSRALRCTISVRVPGTMAFSIRTSGQLCAGWVHIDVAPLPDLTETDAAKAARERADTLNRSIKTKMPTWRPCTV